MRVRGLEQVRVQPLNISANQNRHDLRGFTYYVHPQVPWYLSVIACPGAKPDKARHLSLGSRCQGPVHEVQINSYIHKQECIHLKNKDPTMFTRSRALDAEGQMPGRVGRREKEREASINTGQRALCGLEHVLIYAHDANGVLFPHVAAAGGRMVPRPGKRGSTVAPSRPMII